MGILANHVPSVEPLRPGVVEVIETNGQSKKWFGMLGFLGGRWFRPLTTLFLLCPVSGGFASVHPNSSLTINAVEAAPLDQFSLDVSIADLEGFMQIPHLPHTLCMFL